MQVISRIDLRGRAPASLSRTALAGVLPRAATHVEAAVAQIRPVCDDVKHRGAEAVREYTARFDGVDLATTRVPPEARHGGLPHPSVLAACALLGVREVHAAGGAQALAMFAYGTSDCAPADVITGPGNVYVAAAKRVLRGVVGTDGEAGPTEVAIIADDTADPRHVAADLVAQAEPDELAACLLVTTDPALPDSVDTQLSEQAAATHHPQRGQP